MIGIKHSDESSEENRQNLLEECLRLKLPVEENDDFELLQLIYEAAKERESGSSNYFDFAD